MTGHLIDQAADELLGDGTRWAKVVATWTVPGTSFSHAVSRDAPHKFDKYHDAIIYQVDEKTTIEGGAKMRWTGLHDESSEKDMFDSLCHLHTVRPAPLIHGYEIMVNF